ncbi:yos1-like protein [Botryosphaeria dothidea]|uniref:Yos1-like protein n=1 Tax=Botryosphaeria dothidea TaxID=55169 RepID=A0A8H4IYQ4_9PEZI|nr:yos1-like protein [Botryosphaeria dothidea]
MLLFGLGGLFYVSVLLVNAIAILSEDRFLARIGWGQSAEPGFGGVQDSQSVKAKLINLIASVRTLMRSESTISRQSDYPNAHWEFQSIVHNQGSEVLALP